MKILLLESKKKYLDFMKSTLEKLGTVYTYTGFSRCFEDVRKRIETKKMYDLIIIDLDLPEGSALQLLKLLKTYQDELNYDNMKIILLSENENTSQIMNFFSLSDSYFKVKTLDEDVFIKYLNDIKIL